LIDQRHPTIQVLRKGITAHCTAARSVSPLKKGEVLAMAREDDCMREPFVLIGFAGRKLGVPLVQLDPVKSHKATREAIED
jgi:hypothetical protein